MKFRTLLDFYNWLTISTGDLKKDFKALQSFCYSNDFDLLSQDQIHIFWNHHENIRTIVDEKLS